MRRYKVRGGMIFRTADGKTTLKEGAIFDAEEGEVAHMKTHVEVVPPPRPVYQPEPDAVPRRRRGRPPKNRSLSEPPQHTAL